MNANTSWILKGLLLLGLSLQVACASMDVQEAKERGETVRVVVMKTPRGSIERFSSADTDILDRDTKKSLDNLPLDRAGRRYLCQGAKDTEWRNVRQVESELELSFLVESLNGHEKPRRLSKNQMNLLAKIPPCNPYLTDLKIITKLMKGYDLVKVEHL